MATVTMTDTIANKKSTDLITFSSRCFEPLDVSGLSTVDVGSTADLEPGILAKSTMAHLIGPAVLCAGASNVVDREMSCCAHRLAIL